MSGKNPPHAEPPPGPGGINLQSPPSPRTGSPATLAWAEGRNSPSHGKLRSFEEIIADEKMNRTILEIHLKKNQNKPDNLTHDQLGELVFDKLKINPELCIRFNFTSARYDTREIALKPGTDLNPFITTIENFYGHTHHQGPDQQLTPCLFYQCTSKYPR